MTEALSIERQKVNINGQLNRVQQKPAEYQYTDINVFMHTADVDR